MKINVKKIAIVGGSLAVLVYLLGAYAWGGKRGLTKALGKKTKPKEVVKPKGVKPPKMEVQTKQTSSSGGTGGMVTNNQTVPQNYNPRDYGDIVLESVDRGGNILR